MVIKECNQEEPQKIALVKIDAGLYKEIVKLVCENPIDYPSAKNFVEIAVRERLINRKFDVDSRGAIITNTGLLKTGFEGGYSLCHVCGRVFMNDKKNIQKGKRVCSRCSSIIKELANQV